MATNMSLMCSGDEGSEDIRGSITPTIIHGLPMTNEDVFSIGQYEDSRHEQQNHNNDVVYIVVERPAVKKKPFTKKNPKDYTCQVCLQRFANKSQVTWHAKIHKGQNTRKGYRCKICNHAFTAVQQLKQHERVHTGTRPFKCPICPKTFKQMSHIRSHVKTHPSTRSFQCPYGNCKKTFRFSNQLKNHEEEQHFDLQLDGLYKCNWSNCDRVFTECRDLEIHVNNHKADTDIHRDNLVTCPLRSSFKLPSHDHHHHDDHQHPKPQTFEIGITDDHIELHDDEEVCDDDEYCDKEGDGVITPFMCEICYSVYSKESSYYRHVKECREKQKSAEETCLGDDIDITDDDDDEEVEDDDDDIENMIADDGTPLISLFQNGYSSIADYSSGGGSSQMQFISQQLDIGIPSLMGNSNNSHLTQATSDEATPPSNCIDSVGDQKDMCEGQRFLRFLLQENRRRIKRLKYEQN